jgi:hypothetical protein
LLVADRFWLVDFFAHIGWTDKLQVDRAESRGAVLSRDGVVHRTAGDVFELLVADRFWFVNFFAHIGWLGVWFLVGVGARILVRKP